MLGHSHVKMSIFELQYSGQCAINLATLLSTFISICICVPQMKRNDMIILRNIAVSNLMIACVNILIARMNQVPCRRVCSAAGIVEP